MLRYLVIAGLVGAFSVTAVSAAEKGPGPVQKYRPRWGVGDQWQVETQTLQQQAAGPAERRITARWLFTVQATETIAGHACFRIVVRPTDSPEPQTRVWVDRQTLAIRQIETHLPTPRGYQTIVESYASGATAAPVVGPLSVLPIDLPQFPQQGTKGLESYQYEAIAGSGGTKAIGEVGFITEIRQEFSKPSAKRLKDLDRDRQLKDLKEVPQNALVEVRLKTANYSTYQLWRQGTPWPIWADNGVTQARLIKVTRGAGTGNGSNDQPATNRSAPNVTVPTPNDDPTKALETGNGREQGQAAIVPWSGYWWPIGEGRLLVPLGKYDLLTGRHAAGWEEQHNPPGSDVPHWFGYCHAWSAAAVLEREPAEERRFAHTPSAVDLSIGDQKGLLTICHTEDLANSWGDRFGDGEGSEDPADLQPVQLWRLLKLHLGQRGAPLVVDVEAGEQVWNYPVFQYQLRYRPIGDGRFQASLTLLMADDAVPPSYRGTWPRKQTYAFTFQMRGSSVVSSSGQWIGRSQQDHPDFAWYPYKAVASNPEIEYPVVQQLVTSGGQPDTPETHPTPPVTTSPDVTTNPQPTNPPDVATNPPPAPSHPTAPTAPAANGQQANAPVVLSPIELVALIADKTSSFALDATVDRFDGASYRPGETFFLRVKSQRPGYLYVLQVDSSGTPSLLYPVAGENNHIVAGKLLEIRPRGAAGGFPVVGPAGVVRVKTIVTSRPVVFSGSLQQDPTQRQNAQQSATENPLRHDTTPTQRPNKTAPQQRPKERQPQEPAQRRRRQKRPPTDVQANQTRQQATVSPVQSPVHPVQFRWHPTQQQQIKQLLAGKPGALDASQLQCETPQEVLGPFAQDMTMFYVDAMPPASKIRNEK